MSADEMDIQVIEQKITEINNRVWNSKVFRAWRLNCSKSKLFEEYKDNLFSIRYSDLLADLKSNPYLVGVDELALKCNEKKRQQVELNLTVTTFVR